MSAPLEIAGVVLEVVRGHTGSDIAVTLDSRLFDGGLELDSIGFLEVILQIEKRVGLRLRDEDLTEGALASVGSLVCHIERLVRESR